MKKVKEIPVLNPFCLEITDKSITLFSNMLKYLKIPMDEKSIVPYKYLIFNGEKYLTLNENTGFEEYCNDIDIVFEELVTILILVK